MFQKLADKAVQMVTKALGEEQSGSVAPSKRTKRTPPAGYRAGVDPEFDYFNPPKMAKAMKEGGQVKKNRRDGLAQRGLTKGTMR